MKIILKISIIVAIVLLLGNCKIKQKQIEYSESKDSIALKTFKDSEVLEIFLAKGENYNYPTFVIWVEDMHGNFIKTLFITQSYATGIFGHEMVGDSMWLNKPGPSYQPAALPYWTFKKGKINNKTYVPTSKNPYVDGYTGETPIKDFKFKTAVDINNGKYRVLLEVNQTWDWNKYWTNNKYPKNDAYKHSAQPSLIYAVTITDDSDVFYLNPIGHGDPKGKSGKLYTNISTLTTAKNIFKSIKIKL